MSTEIFGILFMFFSSLALAIPFGKYIANVYAGNATFMNPVFNPIERLFYKISGIDPSKEMNWKQHMVAMLSINFVWFILGMIILMTQQWLPFNPDNNPNMAPDLAFNTTISFLVNCNIKSL